MLKDTQNTAHDAAYLINNFQNEKRRIAAAVAEPGFQPPIDLFETETELVCVVELPGVAPQDFEVKVRAEQLHICGERREIPGYDQRYYHELELNFGYFERIVEVPHAVVERSLRIENLGGLYLIRLRKT
ncbi:MAG: Hsp20/alpha crystallin family protein [bacterium]